MAASVRRLPRESVVVKAESDRNRHWGEILERRPRAKAIAVCSEDFFKFSDMTLHRFGPRHDTGRRSDKYIDIEALDKADSNHYSRSANSSGRNTYH